MNGPIDGLLSTLHLTDTGARTSEDIFTGPSQWMPLGRVFGGQVLAQSLIAAMHTVPEDRTIHSMHGYFLRPGDVEHPITFSVDRLHDGRSFSTRRTQAYQNGEPILSLIASFQTADEGLDHQVEMPDDLPDPESLPSTADVLGALDHDVARYWSNERAFDVRHIPSPVYLTVEGERMPHQAVWMKAFGRLPDDPNLHRAALAYASDYSILEPVLRAHGVAWATPGLQGREPRPRDVVAPRRARRRVAALHAGVAVGERRARPLAGPHLHARRHARRERRPGGHGARCPSPRAFD